MASLRKRSWFGHFRWELIEGSYRSTPRSWGIKRRWITRGSWPCTSTCASSTSWNRPLRRQMWEYASEWERRSTSRKSPRRPMRMTRCTTSSNSAWRPSRCRRSSGVSRMGWRLFRRRAQWVEGKRLSRTSATTASSPGSMASTPSPTSTGRTSRSTCPTTPTSAS